MSRRCSRLGRVTLFFLNFYSLTCRVPTRRFTRPTTVTAPGPARRVFPALSKRLFTHFFSCFEKKAYFPSRVIQILRTFNEKPCHKNFVRVSLHSFFLNTLWHRSCISGTVSCAMKGLNTPSLSDAHVLEELVTALF